MLQNLHSTFVKLFSIITFIIVLLLLANNTNAQTPRLIYYWNFNTLTVNDTMTAATGCVVPLHNYSVSFPGIPADYSINTNTPQFVFREQPGVSSAWPTVAIEGICFTFEDFTSGSTVGAFLGAGAGNSVRPRNPTDSTEIRLYAPTTGYQNIEVSLATEATGTTVGEYTNYAYSVDSGVTWTNTGLSTTGNPVVSSSVFTANTVYVTDPAAYNNPRFVFRIRDSLHTASSSGNVRFDNIAIQGDTIGTPQALVYFWDFNTFSGTYTNPNFPFLHPDYYRVLPGATDTAYVHMGLFPGTSLSYAGYFDEVSTSTYSSTDGDTVNASWPGVPALLPTIPVVTPCGPGTTGSCNPGIRTRNPQDSAYLYFYMPTTNYKNITLSFATESSSLTSGDSIQLYNYSVDSGATWRLSGITEAWDSAWIAGMPTGTFGYRPTPIIIHFTDPQANNNSKLIFRIHEKGRNSGGSGNNRFDNIAMQGDSIITDIVPLSTITTTPTAYGPLCNTTANTISVPFTSSGVFGSTYYVQITNWAGVFPADATTGIIGSGTTSPITAVIPSGTLAGTNYRIRVISATPVVYGSDNGSNITLNGVAGPITGRMSLCAAGSLDTLFESGAGTWSFSNANANIGSSTGIVTSATTGLDTVTYTIGVGCIATATITINPVPATITGTLNACATGTVGTTLSDATPLGTWSSSNTAVATIGSGTGAVTGITSGTSVISYTLSTGCATSQSVTVNPLPSAITGTTVACVGLGTTLTDAGGGTWSSSNSGVASVGSSTGAVSGASNGVATITYTLPTGCVTTTPYTVNPNPAAISGSNGCVGVGTPFTDATAFGAWSSSNPGVATVGSASGIVTGVSVGTATISYTLSTGCLITKAISINPVPSSITGTAVVCAGLTTTLSNTTPGGTWSSGNIAVATVGSTGIVTGVAAGNATVSYTLPTGCIATQVVTVSVTPPTPSGPTSVYCIPNTVTLTDVVGGGVWTSSNPGVATVGSSSGIVTSVSAGTATITYTLGTGCQSTLGESVTSSPAAIVGTSIQCVGSSSNLTDLTAFGAWSSSNIGVATIGSGTGIMTGVASGAVTITYQLSPSCVTTKNFTVNPVPEAISGIASACEGLTSTLSDTGSGTWSSSVPALAAVGATTGVVTAGTSAGNPVITYTAASGCYTTTIFTVNPLPGPIAGTGSVYCIGSTSTLVDGTPGGTWSSGNTTVATIGSSSGIVTGVSAGSATITYTLPTGCINTLVENISSTPAPITGVSGACILNNATYSDVTAFGAWSSSNTAIATIGSGTGVLTGVSAGAVTITYELSPICLITKSVTVNPNPNPVSGTLMVCPGTTTTLIDAGGGTWASSIPALATIGSGSGIVSGLIAGTVNITYTLPTGCFNTTPVTINPLPSVVGPTNICEGIPTVLAGSIGGGTWVSSNPGIATIGSSSGSITGLALGSTTITYTLPTGCTATSVVSVSPPPTPITGATQVCLGLTTTLTDAGGGGWYSSNPSVATVGFGTGTVTGITAGTTTISYSLGTTCIVTETLTVNPLPAAITGTMVVCPGVTSTLGDVSTGGSWTSSNTALATVGSGTGVVTGVAGGMPTITYTLPTGCINTTVVTVNPVSPITGTMNVCVASTTTLSDGLSGGTWTSSSTALATVGTGSGIVTGVGAGTPTITYTLPTGCYTTAMVTVNPIPATITGTANVCEGSSVTLGDITAGGVWSTSDPSTATVGSGTGIVFGVSNGSCAISYSLPTGCLVSTGFVVNPLPSSITGMLQSCVGNPDTLSDVPSGGSWLSASTGIATIGSASGIATGVSSGSTTITYTLPTGCVATTTYTVNPLPLVDTVTGGGAYCAGAAGSHVRLSGSDTGINYQLYNGVTAVGGAMPGSGSGLDFGVFATTGSYTVKATNATTSCGDNMYGTAVITINPLPNINTITGGGNYCVGDTGVHVGLGGSDTGVNYQLYRGGTTTVGSALPGIGFPLDFGLQTVPGSYTLVAENPVTTCTSNMVGTAVVNEDTLYTPVVTITAHPASGIDYGQNDTLHATVTNGGPGYTYQWVVNATFIAGATNATYVYTNNFANGDSITCLVTSHSFCGSVTQGNYSKIQILNVSVNQVVANNIDLKLIPNPNNGLFTIKGTLGTTNDEEVTLTITDMLGQMVYSKNIVASGGNINELIQLNGAMANGMYILDVRSGNDNKVFHFVLKQ